ncbi:cytosine/adenosine deaminase-related metal-dependent hydrolase [Paenibacillus rhizosphaerae]|uniref:Cytosine/adenosine deaminase-related metal-dependent hydrolase n=1 Tax=Paenibacillus rhizosphaerae TaxID=297318 RepID=A0A839TPV3_9BACL|nr:amidohydrolase [Paenibacillus rhizosphaerae]MBB3129014.1 cytosine/adenosine deaminase-related metal-dependent hydrolase [Paenibacillus rhizosphaerae]
MQSALWLTNVRLESGLQTDNGVVTGTETELCHLLIRDGRITDKMAASQAITDDLPRLDARSYLALPSFIEKHCHLDKTLLGSKWRPVTPAKHIFDRLDEEKRLHAEHAVSIAERASLYLETALRSGVTHVRTHVDIYPEAGLKQMEEVQKALQAFEGKLTYEIVAFPQQGLLRSKSAELVREALRSGASLVGGVDPATVDGDVEQSLRMMVELAASEGAGIDLHLHDPDHLGLFTLKRLASLTREAGLAGKVAVSHAFCLGDIPAGQAEAAADMLAEAGIGIITSVPMNRKFPPVRLLQGRGVSVSVGCDNVFDVWSPFGNGDILERAGRLAEISGWANEQSLAQGLQYITGGVTPLDAEGRQAWPRIGDEASLALVDASCSAEAVARKSARVATLFRGSVVAGALD